jgi:hypothetical protein
VPIHSTIFACSFEFLSPFFRLPAAFAMLSFSFAKVFLCPANSAFAIAVVASVSRNGSADRKKTTEQRNRNSFPD